MLEAMFLGFLWWLTSLKKLMKVHKQNKQLKIYFFTTSSLFSLWSHCSCLRLQTKFLADTLQFFYALLNNRMHCCILQRDQRLNN